MVLFWVHIVRRSHVEISRSKVKIIEIVFVFKIYLFIIYIYIYIYIYILIFIYKYDMLIYKKFSLNTKLQIFNLKIFLKNFLLIIFS